MAHIRRDKRARSALRTEELPVKRGRLGEGTDSGRCNLSLLSDTGSHTHVTLCPTICSTERYSVPIL